MKEESLSQHNRDEMLHDLMTTYGQDVWNFAFSLFRNRAVTDDITQDVFLKAYRKIDSFVGQSSIKSWLLAITKNTVRDHWRSNVFRKVIPIGFLEKDGMNRSAEEDALDAMEAEELWNQVLHLPVKYREVLVL